MAGGRQQARQTLAANRVGMALPMAAKVDLSAHINNGVEPMKVLGRRDYG